MAASSGRVRSSPVALGDVVGDKYRVERVLGSGGMGVVVAARHLELDQQVALKFILPEALSGKGNVERFMREARATVRLKSEHVARVYDVGRDAQGRPYMVLELLDGMDLAKLNRERGPLPVADAVEYVLQACEALIEAHSMGIVHRDLKPQNLFVTKRLNGSPLVKVLDFGISKFVGPEAAAQMSLTDSATIIGSPLYMAPEQMRAERGVDLRTDIWAMGVLLYELLGGQLPFEGDTVTALVIKVVNEAPESLLALRPALDGTLVAAVMKCLEKRPDQRWQNVAQLASALEPFSRSAKQGGLVRPWRSFEDTQDSHERPNLGPADATGPATAVKFSDTVEQDSSPKPKQMTVNTPAFAATDVTWGEATTDPPPKPARSRAFGAGLAAGAIVALAAAAAGLFYFRTPARAPAALVASAPPPQTASALPAAEPVRAAPPEATSPAAIAVSALPPAGKKTPTTRAPRHAAPEPSVAPAHVEPRPAAVEKPPPDPVSPNGAPILR
jgi:serine/threonine protein kinase